MENVSKWARAMAARISDEWEGREDFPEDAKLLENILFKLLKAHPNECFNLIGTGIIEEDYFDRLS